MDSRPIVGLASLGTTAALVVALITFIAGDTPVATIVQQPARRDTAGSNARPDTVSGNGRALLREFLAARDTVSPPRVGRPAAPGAMPVPAPAGREADGGSCTRPVNGACYRLSILVATLPDPLDSGMDWAFDAGWEAIRRGFERAGYVVDRFWLPWAVGADSVGRGPAIRTQRPGVVLFRHRQPANHSLRLLYLVGEVPTAGVYKRAMAEALREADALLRDTTLIARDAAAMVDSAVASPRCDALCPTELRIIGPTFSGSTPSLRIALREHGTSRQWSRYRIVSGAASNEKNREQLSWSDAGVTPAAYSATVHVDSVLRAVSSHVLHDRLGIPPNQVAVLIESSTQYGQLATVSRAGGDATQPLEVPFPMNISRLRSEMERRGTTAATPPTLGAQRPVLPVDLGETRRTVTNAPVFSDLTPPAVGGVIAEIAQTLAAHRVRAVGIVASDVRDVVFLATEVRRRFRDVLLFTYNGNTLYAHPEFNTDLRGMLIFATYSLTLEAQYWDVAAGARQRVAFTTNLAQGIHNATLRQLGAAGSEIGARFASSIGANDHAPVWVTVVGRGAMFPVALLPTGPGTAAAPPADSARPAPGPNPGANVGRDGLAELHDGPHPPIELPMFLFVLGIGAAGLLAWRHLQELRTPPGPAAARAPPAALPPSDAAEGEGHAPAAVADEPRARLHSWLSLQAAIFGLVRLLALALGLLLLRVVLDFWVADRWGVAFDFLQGVAALLVGGAVVATGVLAVRHARRSGVTPVFGTPAAAERAGRRIARHILGGGELVVRAAIAVVVLGGAVVATSYLVQSAVTAPQRPNALAFLWRFAALGGGVSPGVPILLGAVLLSAWAVWHRHRLRLYAELPEFERYCDRVWRAAPDDDRARMPLVPTDAWSARPADREAGMRLLEAHRVAEQMWRMRARLFFVLPSALVAVVGLLVLVVGLWTLANFTNTVESITFQQPLILRRSAFDWLLHGLVIGSLLVTSLGLYRFLAVWLALRACLTELSMTRLFPAFRRLPIPVARLTRLMPWSVPSDTIVDGAFHRRWQELRDAESTAAKRTRELLATLAKRSDRAGRLAPSSGDAADTQAAEASLRATLARAAAAGDTRLITTLTKAFRATRASNRERASRAAEAARLSQEVQAKHGCHVYDVATFAADTAAAPPLRASVSTAGGAADSPVPVLVAKLAVLWERFTEAEASTEQDPCGQAGGEPAVRHARLVELRRTEECLAIFVVEYIEWALRHLRYLAGFVLLASVLTTLLLASYPFYPQGAVKLHGLLLLVATPAALMVVLYQMSKDELLSNITHTDLGRVTWDGPFIMNVVVFVFVPLLTLLSTEVPEVREFLFSWLTPLLRTAGRM